MKEELKLYYLSFSKEFKLKTFKDEIVDGTCLISFLCKGKKNAELVAKDHFGDYFYKLHTSKPRNKKFTGKIFYIDDVFFINYCPEA